MFICVACFEPKPETEYYRNPSSVRYKECKRCHNERCKKNVGARRLETRAFIRSLKDNPCTDCGVKYHPAAMQFDHVRGRKLFGVASARDRAHDVILAEVAKCELRCANCHAIRHDAQNHPRAAS